MKPASLRKLHTATAGAVADRGLLERVSGALGKTKGRRAERLREMDFPAARDEARRIRLEALDRLDALTTLFGQKLKENGGALHRAKDGAEACRIVNSLLKERTARLVVKSKSMMSEEVGLSAALRRAGIETVETDLGELLVDLRGEPPSHITAPALHMSAQDAEDTFVVKGLMARGKGNDIPLRVAAAARQYVRRMVGEADAGITGANFLAAETGSVFIVENEANARQVFTVPPLHIVVTGMERIVESPRDAAHLLPLLTASSTGQRLTSYVSEIRRPGGELHVVLVDNGRSRLLADGRMRDVLTCIRCGACLNHCPVFGVVGGHAYLGVYPSAMGLVLRPALNANDIDIVNLCTSCGECDRVCPVAIPLTERILQWRSVRTEQRGWERLLARLYGFAAKRPLLWRAGAALLRPLRRWRR